MIPQKIRALSLALFTNALERLHNWACILFPARPAYRLCPVAYRQKPRHRAVRQ